MAKHSKIGASSMPRWANCPGSVKLSENIPSKSSVYADEGTLAHEVAAKLLLGECIPHTSEEMLSAVMVYVNLINEEKKDCKIWVEHAFDMGKLHPDLFGTADCVIWDEKEKILKVIDYKHGSGTFVDVKNNDQLLYYALGATLTLDVHPKEIEVIIVQPRIQSETAVRKWRFPAIDIIEFSSRLLLAVKATLEPNAPLNPGSWCKWCNASGFCPALEKNALAIAQSQFTPIVGYDPIKLGKTLNQLPILEAFIKNVREFAYQEAQMGRVPPGWKLVEKRAMRKWKFDDEKIVTALADKFYEQELFEKKLKSPAQLEKIVHKSNLHIFDGLITKESSGLTLVPIDDKREEIKKDVLQVFEVIND